MKNLFCLALAILVFIILKEIIDFENTIITLLVLIYWTQSKETTNKK